MALEKSSARFNSYMKVEEPKNLGDCLKQDKITTNLWDWAHNLEVIGQVLLVIILIIGVIETISTATSASGVQASGSVSTFLTIAVLVKWIMYAVIEYCIYNVLSLLVGSLASIVYHTKVSAQISELKYRGKNITEEKNENVHKTVNHTNSETNNSVQAEDGTWLCEECGCRNQKNAKYCKNCGGQK